MTILRDKHKNPYKRPFNENWLIIIAVIFALAVIIVLNTCEAENFKPYVKKYAKKNDIKTWLVYNIIEVESKYNKYAVSSKKAVGLCQIKTIALKHYFRLTGQHDRKVMNYDILKLFVAKKNIMVGCRYYKWCLDYCKGDTMRALSMYNTGIKANWNGVYNVKYINKVTGVSKEDIRRHLYPVYRLAYNRLFKRGE